MITMSLFCLRISEQSLYENQLKAFQNDVMTIATGLERQSVISMEWLSKMEARSGYTLFVLDNGVPFLYHQLKEQTASPRDSALLDDCLAAYRHGFLNTSAAAIDTSDSPYDFHHTEFIFAQESSGRNYYAGIIANSRGSHALEVIILSPLEHLEAQTAGQRLRFIVIDAAAVLLLAVFSYFFTGKLLQPVMESQRKQTEFIAAASHELRTPLALILACAECCSAEYFSVGKQSSVPMEKQRGFLETIQREGLRMSSLIGDMLTLSQSDNQRFILRPQSVELDTLLMNSFEAFEPFAGEKSIRLLLRLPEASVKPCIADPERISQVIAILLHNAVSYTPAGGCITLSLESAGNHFEISVADTGIGIAKEDKKKIFERFYRAEKSRSATGHFGLGLSIAYEIIKLHHGNITVSDNQPCGSIFHISLPYHSDKSILPPASAMAAPPMSAATASKDAASPPPDISVSSSDCSSDMSIISPESSNEIGAPSPGPP